MAPTQERPRCNREATGTGYPRGAGPERGDSLTKKLSVEEAFALVEQRRSEWCLLGISLTTRVKTYLCRTCGKWLSLVSPGATLPARCPKCDTVLRAPDENSVLFSHLIRPGAERTLCGKRAEEWPLGGFRRERPATPPESVSCRPCRSRLERQP